MAMAMPSYGADVTAERLLNTANEPQNWLLVHRDYNNSRHSPLKDTNLSNVKNLKLKFMASIGGMTTGGTLPARKRPPRSSTTASCTSTTPGAGS